MKNVNIQLGQGQVISSIIEYIYHVSKDAGVALNVNARIDDTEQKNMKER